MVGDYPQVIPISTYIEWYAKTLKWGIISIKWDEVDKVIFS